MLVAIGLAVYANSLGNELFWDDYENILDNHYLRDWRHFPKFFSEPLNAGSGLTIWTWRPALLIIWSILWRLFDYWPPVYHFANIAFHIANAVLIYFLFKKLFQKPAAALLPALIFLIHPVQNEGVNVVSFLGEPLWTFFFLLSANFYCLFRQDNKRAAPWQNRYYWLAFLAAALALLAKEMAVVIPALLLVMDFLFLAGGKNWKDKLGAALKALWPFLLISAIYVVLRLTVLDFPPKPNFSDLSEYYHSASLGIRFVIVSYSLMKFFSSLFWPVGLRIEGGNAEESVLKNDLSFAIGGSAIILGLIALAILTKKRWPAASLGIFWFFIGLAPLLNPITPARISAQEHLFYFPLIGIAAALCFAGTKLLPTAIKWRQIAAAAFVILVIFLSALTISRNLTWQNFVTLFADYHRKMPPSARSLNGLAIGYLLKRDYQKAEPLYLQARDLDPNLPITHINLGRLYYETGRTELAVKELETANRLLPDTYQILVPLAGAYARAGDGKTAEDYYFRAIELKPNFPAAYYDLAMMYQNLGRGDAAITYYQKTLELDPTSIGPYVNIANIYLARRDSSAVRQIAERAIKKLRGLNREQFQLLIDRLNASNY